MRNKFGRLVDRDTLETLVSVSSTEGPCPIAGLWSYRIHGAVIPKRAAEIGAGEEGEENEEDEGREDQSEEEQEGDDRSVSGR